MSVDTAPTGIDRADARRVAVVLLAVVAFQIVFAASYIGAFHDPQPDDVPVGVIAPTADAAATVIEQIPPTDALDIRIVANEVTARSQLADQELYAAWILGADGDTFLVATAASPAIAEQFVSQFEALAQQSGRAFIVEDVAPLGADDSRGLLPFYLVLTWVVGGYLGATMIGLVKGARVPGRAGVVRRIGALGAYAVVSGLTLTAVTAVLFGVVTTSFVPIALAGTVIVLSVGLTAAALQTLLGSGGTAVVLVLFVAFGNPASGGPAPRPSLPNPWRDVGPFTPNGAGTDLARRILYFDGNNTLPAIGILVAWAAIGALIMLAVGRPRPTSPIIGEGEAAALAAS